MTATTKSAAAPRTRSAKTGDVTADKAIRTSRLAAAEKAARVEAAKKAGEAAGTKVAFYSDGEPVEAPAAKAPAKKAPAAKAPAAAPVVVKAKPAAKVAKAPAADALPNGYGIKYDNGAYLLAKFGAGEVEGGTATVLDAGRWIVICTAHRTTTFASKAKAGDALGRKAARAGWCGGCAAEAK